MNSMRLIVTIFAFLVLYSVAIADQSSNIRIINRPIQLIAIDPGFGGRETGPSGCSGKVFAKDINLKISKKIAEKIKNDLGFDTILTRETDIFVCLEERTAIANTTNADLFISIHVNGFNDPQAYGIETYSLMFVTDNNAISTAVKENSNNPKTFNDLSTILKDLISATGYRESKSLAEQVQSSLVSNLESKYDHIKNRGVKSAPFYILIGASMPSIVVQCSFITNTRECERLKTEEYQEAISTGIVEGIRKYIKDRTK